MSHHTVCEQPVVSGFPMTTCILWNSAAVWQMMCDLYGLGLCLLMVTARPTKTLLLHIVISDTLAYICLLHSSGLCNS